MHQKIFPRWRDLDSLAALFRISFARFYGKVITCVICQIILSLELVKYCGIVKITTCESFLVCQNFKFGCEKFLMIFISPKPSIMASKRDSTIFLPYNLYGRISAARKRPYSLLKGKLRKTAE